jgi:hypothetical protein
VTIQFITSNLIDEQHRRREEEVRSGRVAAHGDGDEEAMLG